MDRIFDNIKSTVLNIEEELKRINETGIYFAPELYVAFEIGKNIYVKRKELFPNAVNITWEREVKLGDGGLSDIVFKIDGVPLVIELKLRDKDVAYMADIEKLKNLKGNYLKYFCVLSDCFAEQNDNRLKMLEEKYQGCVQNIGHYAFETKFSWYQKKTFCNLNLYKVD